jgi:probable HAF family extracellular repeat protein
MTMKKIVTCLIGALLLGWATLRAQPAWGYEFVDLGAMAERVEEGLSPYFYPAAINDAGVVVFNVINESGDYRAVRFDGTKAEGVTPLATQPPWVGRNNAAADVNGRGEIVGHSRVDPDSAATHAFRFVNGRVRDIGSPDRDYSEAIRINDRGEVLGCNAGDNKEFWVRARGELRRLSDLVGPGARAVDLNNQGHVLGVAAKGAFIHDLDSGSTSYLDGMVGTVGAINDRDVVASVANGALYRWSAGKAEELGLLGEEVISVRRMNKVGDIVGVFRSQTGGVRAFLFSNGQLIDLNGLVSAAGWVLRSADAVNNRGEIVGSAVAADGTRHAYLLRPRR